MKISVFGLTCIALLISLISKTTVNADVVFAVNSTNAATLDRVVRISVNPDGTVNTSTTLWSTTTTSITPRGLAYDSSSNRVFWSDSVTRDISSVSASDGSGFAVFNRNNGSTQSLAIESAASKLYVYEAGSPTSNEAITQMNFNGSSPSTFVPGPDISPNTWMTISSGFLYYTDNTGILRRSLDGATTETIVAAAPNGFRGIAVLNDNIFWLDNTGDTVNRRLISDTSASVSTLSLGTGSTPQGLTTDGEFLFYAEQGNISSRGINRFSPDLTGLVNVVQLSTTEIANGIAAIPEPGSLALLAGAVALFGGAGYRRKMFAHKLPA